jgi:Raf kinase inhibitor-like YbhB/YbcL family protein
VRHALIALAQPLDRVRHALIALALMLAGCGGGSSSSTSASRPTSSASRPTSSSTTTSDTTSTASTTTTTAKPPSGVTPGQHLAAGFHLTSPAFRPGGAIPRAYTCDGRGTPLPLHWTGIPKAAKELVLVMRDPDAPGGPFVHWAVAGISTTSTGFPSGGISGHVVLGRNSFGANAYGGPCPPKGSAAHHYVLTLSALASPSGLRTGFSPDELRARALAIATLIGTYARR